MTLSENLRLLNQWMLKHPMRGYSIMPQYNSTTKTMEHEATGIFEDGDMYIKVHTDKTTVTKELLDALTLHEELTSTD